MPALALGVAYRILPTMQNIINFFTIGGFFMIPLLFCSLISLTVIIERFSALARSRVLGTRLPGLIEAEDFSINDLERASQREKTTLSRLVREIFTRKFNTRDEALEHLRTTARRETNRMERGLVVLEIVAALAPLLGLLGTVSGLVTVFGNIGPDEFGEKGVEVARGISEALTTTIAGLVIAIPSLVCWNLLSRKIDTLTAELEHLLQVAINQPQHPAKQK